MPAKLPAAMTPPIVLITPVRSLVGLDGHHLYLAYPVCQMNPQVDLTWLGNCTGVAPPLDLADHFQLPVQLLEPSKVY